MHRREEHVDENCIAAIELQRSRAIPRYWYSADFDIQPFALCVGLDCTLLSFRPDASRLVLFFVATLGLIRAVEFDLVTGAGLFDPHDPPLLPAADELLQGLTSRTAESIALSEFGPAWSRAFLVSGSFPRDFADHERIKLPIEISTKKGLVKTASRVVGALNEALYRLRMPIKHGRDTCMP